MSDLTPEARALLDSAMPGLEPTADQRMRVRSAVTAQIAVGIAAGAAVAVASKGAAGAASAGVVGAGAAVVGAGGVTAGTATAGAAGFSATMAGASLITPLFVKVAASLALVGAIGVGTATYESARAPKATPEHRAETSTVLKPSTPVAATAKAAARPRIDIPEPGDPATSSPSPVTAAQVMPAPAPVTRFAAPVTPGAAPATNPPPPVIAARAPASSIGAEVALLGAANAEMQGGNAPRALTLLDDHARRFPLGALTEEREAARILALCAVGRGDESREAKGRFLREHPSSPHVARVRSACGAFTPGAEK